MAEIRYFYNASNVQEIKEASSREGQSDAEVEVAEVSLSSLDSVRRFCRDFNAREQPLDILVLNAGIMV